MARFINLMEGYIWLESEGLGKGCTATFVVKLGMCNNSKDSLLQVLSRPHPSPAELSGDGVISSKFQP